MPTSRAEDPGVGSQADLRSDPGTTSGSPRGVYLSVNILRNGKHGVVGCIWRDDGFQNGKALYEKAMAYVIF